MYNLSHGEALNWTVALRSAAFGHFWQHFPTPIKLRSPSTRWQEAQVHGSVCVTARPSEAGVQEGEGKEPRCGVPAGIWLQHERSQSWIPGGVLQLAGTLIPQVIITSNRREYLHVILVEKQSYSIGYRRSDMLKMLPLCNSCKKHWQFKLHINQDSRKQTVVWISG